MRHKIKMLIASLTCLAANGALCMSAFASGINDSVAITGTQKLINDGTTALLVIAPVVGAACIIYFCIRRSAADEMDQKKWNNRIVTAIVSTIGAVVGASLLNIIVGYYQ